MYKPESLPQLIPYLTVVNVQESIKFYTEAFCFELIDSSCDSVNNHAEMRKDNVVIMFCSEGSYGTIKKAPITQNIEIPLSLYVYCDDVDEFYKNAINHGAISKLSPNDGFWGDRFCVLNDLNGYEWLFAMKIHDK